MKTLRIALVGLALPALSLAAGCQTEKSTRTTEIKRSGDTTTVKTHEKRETDHGKSEKIEKRTYHD